MFRPGRKETTRITDRRALSPATRPLGIPAILLPLPYPRPVSLPLPHSIPVTHLKTRVSIRRQRVHLRRAAARAMTEFLRGTRMRSPRFARFLSPCAPPPFLFIPLLFPTNLPFPSERTKPEAKHKVRRRAKGSRRGENTSM